MQIIKTLGRSCWASAMEAKKQQMAKEMAMVCFEITRLVLFLECEFEFRFAGFGMRNASKGMAWDVVGPDR